MKKNDKAKKAAISGILIAIAVVFGTFSIPAGAARISPVQHFVNVVAAVVLGPWEAVLSGFAAAVLRNIMGTGSLLAFPGSMIGPLIAGYLYKYSKKLISAVFGEIIGTGILGGMAAYPVAKFLMGKETAVFGFVVPFLISCTAGALIAYVFLKIPVINKMIIKRTGKA